MAQPLRDHIQRSEIHGESPPHPDSRDTITSTVVADEPPSNAAMPLTAGAPRPPEAGGPRVAAIRESRRGRERGSNRASEAFRIYFGNVTSWNSGVLEYAKDRSTWMGESDVICLVETHLKLPRSCRRSRRWIGSATRRPW